MNGHLLRGIGLPVTALLALTLLAGCGSAASSGRALAAITPSPAVTASSASATASVRPSRQPSVQPTPKPTPKPTPRPTLKPTVRPTTPGAVPGRYVTGVAMPRACLTVSPAIVGIKVYLVQKALHLVGHKDVYDSATAGAVRAFQLAHHLPVTGVVDRTTWTALRTGYDFCVDAYTQQPVVPAGAGAAARIEAMIGYAAARQGVPYVWGGAGPMGFDCSGMVIQALYAGGVVVPGLNTYLHVQADFRSTHAIYASALPHVALSQRRRGDLIFYGFPITHMAIYLGGGQIVEAVRPVIRVASTWADGMAAQPYVVRPFPG